jgi:hypothetical protein
VRAGVVVLIVGCVGWMADTLIINNQYNNTQSEKKGSQSMEDKVRAVVLAICYALIAICVVGLLVALRIDVGKDAFYTGLLVVGVVLFVFAVQSFTMFGARMAQTSDNVQAQMAGIGKAALEYASIANRQATDQLRIVQSSVSSAPSMPALPWMTADVADDEPQFDAVEDVDWVGNSR